MYRAALRSSPGALRAIRPATNLTSTSRRFLTTGPANKRRTWKGLVARWGLAGAAVYWYNTSPIFADEPVSQTVPAPLQFSDSDLPTVEAVIEQKRREARASSNPASPPLSAELPRSAEASSSAETPLSQETGSPAPSDAHDGLLPGSPESLEEEAGQQGAFNPETGEINWDCPCLGGMAHGPCGEDFKAAFSCFVYSEQEPKGMDCIDKFQQMQDCFRKYPDIYGAELQEDDEEDSTAPVAGPGDISPGTINESEVASANELDAQRPADGEGKPEETVHSSRIPEVRNNQERSTVPIEAVDATDANKEKEA